MSSPGLEKNILRKCDSQCYKRQVHTFCYQNDSNLCYELWLFVYFANLEWINLHNMMSSLSGVRNLFLENVIPEFQNV